MKVSLNWAQWHSNVDLEADGVDKLIEKIGAQLGEIEEVVHYAARYKGIVVAKVISRVKHPNADKLSICKIDTGKETVQVVCGAPNVAEGLLVAWIPPGATVPSTYHKEPFVLEAREIRGEMSNGMIASPSELDISDDKDGILEIEPSDEIKLGMPLEKLYGLDDVVIDIENKMFTHRPDCFGVLGVARELAGIQAKAFESPDWYMAQPKFAAADELKLRVVNELPELVPRFMAVAMSEVEVKPSPIWLQAGLKRIGIKSINNVVDITNYLMYITGQPLHAYDYDKVASKSSDGAVLAARYPKKDEKLELLSGKTIKPRKEAIMIATDKASIGLGGVMGGADTEVDGSTKNIIIECANFDLYSIRRTSMEHGLFTDAVTRFSKGQSHLQNDRVLAKAIELMSQQASAKQASEVVDDFKKLPELPVQNIDTKFINDRLGLDLSAEKIVNLLRNVEFVAEITRGSVLVVQAPFWRTDIEIPEDIVEEIGRLYGYDHLPLDLPRRTTASTKIEPKLALKQKVRKTLSSLGANETLNYSFVHGNLLTNARQDPENSYKISSALSPDLQYYRQTLTPSLLAHVHQNIKAGHQQFALFELNKTHNKIHGLQPDEKVPGELNMIALTVAHKSKKASAYFTARAYLDSLAGELGFTLDYLPIDEDPGFPVTQAYNLERSALVTVKETDTFLGIVGEYHPEVIKNFKLPLFSAGLEIGLDHLLAATEKSSSSGYVPISRYPSTIQDLCLRVPPRTSYNDLQKALLEAVESSKPEDVSVIIEPLDIYVPEDKKYKNITFSLALTSYDRTLTEEVANKLLDVASQVVSNKIKATRI